MKLIVATSLIVTTVMHSACAQSEFATPTGARVQGVVIECGSGIAASPCGGAGSPLEVDLGNAATGVSMPLGGQGLLGFLSGIYKILASGQSGSAGGASVAVSNFPASQSVTGSVVIANTPSVATLPSQVGAADCSTLVGIAPVQVVSAGSARKSILIQNVGAANIGFSFTSMAPSLGSAQTFTLQPGGSYISPNGLTPNGAIYVVAAAAATQVACTLFN